MNKRNALRQAAAHLRDLALVEQARWAHPKLLTHYGRADQQRIASAHEELARRLDALATGRRPKKERPPDPNQVALFE